jgi:hypothetical protein
MRSLRFQHWFTLCFALLAACAGGQTGSEGAKGTKGVPTIGDPCTVDRDCQQQLQFALQGLAAPHAHLPVKLLGASCEPVPVGCASPAARYCHCTYTPKAVEKPASFELGVGADCTLYGRSLGCLASSSDFAGCDATACSCVEACQGALDRMSADDERNFDVQARRAVCEHEACRFVLRIDDRCYAGAWPVPGSPTYDCALSDQALLAADASRSDSTSPVCDTSPRVTSLGSDPGFSACQPGSDAGSRP